MKTTEEMEHECNRMLVTLGYLKMRDHAKAMEAKLSERKTVHEWLNTKGTPREENGKPLCLLRRLAIALGIHDELKVRPDSPGFWWMLRPGGEWHIGRAEVIHWGEDDSSERVLAWTAGGIYSRCDMMNTPKDSGTRWAKAAPPILSPNDRAMTPDANENENECAKEQR